ncbi:AvrPphF family type III effector [Pseudomonas syringae]|uniref:Type III effector n=1 Tax=Pseudomonas syringae TaxID=317 RepID=A0A9Q4FK00_PSESX|nr:AvrPphF family type III effector [Pseudomonas syringae]KTB84798.1 type III effector [Pseudomonas syringae pv. syringae PD2766]MCF5467648.1 type III effector [Pseudomonas syringae]MCF5474622.1 type III effector [Pseudomonas syringae]MCF5484140.1 type III effector [Pseudomonas syringae]MCF5487915.1 type III effector [Pseudomonas syringae]
MGNVCGVSGSQHVYSPTASPGRVSGPSTPAHPIGEQRLTSVYQLSPSQREQFLNRHDPMRKFSLDAETPLYRTTDKTYLRKGQLAGNPESCARIALHEELVDNPFASYVGASPGEATAYRPKEMRASDLKHPSLNVMVGSQARDAVRGYAHGNHVAVRMRLGDFLEKGGKVYTDVSAVASNGDTANALIVTLPKGRKVRADVVD